MLKPAELNLTQEWDKTFPKSDHVDHKKVNFINRYGITLAADQYTPKNAQNKLPAVAVCGPFGAVKEQCSGLYAQTLAERGFLTIAFDPSFTGESGGEPRYTASPDINTEDFQAAVDFLSVQDNVDPERIGILGICGWGGLALNAAAIDTRIKATVVSTMYDLSRTASKGYFDSFDSEEARHQVRESYSSARTAIYRSGDYAESSRIGRGTVAAAKVVPIKGSGSILKMHVANGDFVERGELLFETVTGGLDGLYAPGNEIVCETSGIVASVDAGAGASVEKGGKILSIYPDDATRIEMQVRESDLGLVREGMKVDIEFNWDLQRMTRLEGTITGISYLSANAPAAGEDGQTTAPTAGEEPTYTAYVDFTPDESVRLGMTVLVYTRDSHDAEAPEMEGGTAQ